MHVNSIYIYLHSISIYVEIKEFSDALATAIYQEFPVHESTGKSFGKKKLVIAIDEFQQILTYPEKKSLIGRAVF
jgi:hypothetical protein